MIQRGANVEPLGEWTRVGLVVFDTAVPIGATPEVRAGRYAKLYIKHVVPILLAFLDFANTCDSISPGTT